MAWFFADSVSVPRHIITGEDARHISRSLRMKTGETLTVCDSAGIRYDCTIESISDSAVEVTVDSSRPCENEPKTKVVLYQALTKGEKMELIIQKSVELGVSAIVPVMTARCVSRPDEKSAKKKCERWNKIALSAAMQSRRGIIPEVRPIMSFSEAARQAGDTAVVCYELGGVPFGQAPQLSKGEVSLFIGSEGGFEQSEIDELIKRGGTAVTLGRRILRAETAPLAALSVIMYLTGDLGSTEDDVYSPSGGDWTA